MRALLVLVLCGTAWADLPTIDSEHPAALRVSTDEWSVRLERVSVAIRSAPEASWMSIGVTGRTMPAVIDVDVPAGTRVIGLGVANTEARAWGKPLPVETARGRFQSGTGAALLQWNSESADEEHLRLLVDQPGTIELALQLPPLPALEVTADAAVRIEVLGELRFAGKRRGVVELEDVAGLVGRSTAPAIDERVALLAAQSPASDFFEPASPRPMAMRDIDKAIIRRRMTLHKAQLRQCYMAVAQWVPVIEHGGLILSFAIEPDGDVVWARATETDLPATVTDCLVDEVKRWDFPATDGRVLVNYPLEFRLID